MNTKIKGFSKKHKKIISIISFLLVMVFCAVVGWFIGRPIIKFVSTPEKFRLWVDSSGLGGRIAFILMVVFQVVFALIPGEPMEIGAGYAFGAIEGTLLCVIGTTIGSIIVFALVRTLGIRFVEVFFSPEKLKELKILRKSKKRNLLIFLVFFLPGTPKDLLTYFLGITDIKFSSLLILSSVVRLPSLITSTFGGKALGFEEYESAIIIFTISILISIIGWIIYKFLITKQKRK